LYSIVAKKKVWIALEFFFVISQRAKVGTWQRVSMPSARPIALGIHRALPSAGQLALGTESFAECPQPGTRQIITVTVFVQCNVRGNRVATG